MDQTKVFAPIAWIIGVFYQEKRKFSTNCRQHGDRFDLNFYISRPISNPTYYSGLVKPTNTVHYYIDINEIPELKTFSLNENALELGSGITYTKAISLLEKVPNPLSEAFGYANAVAKHLRRIAGTSIRNVSRYL